MNQKLHPKTKEFLDSVVEGTESGAIFYAYLSTNDDVVKKYITDIDNAYIANQPESLNDTIKTNFVRYVGRKISELATKIDPEYTDFVKLELNTDQIPSRYRLIIDKDLKNALKQRYSETFINVVLKRYEKNGHELYNDIMELKKQMKRNDKGFKEHSATFITFKSGLEKSLLHILFSRLLDEGLCSVMPDSLKKLITMYNKLFNEQGISKSGVCVSVSIRRMRNILRMNLENFEGFRDFCEVANDQIFKNQFQLSIEDEADMIFVYTVLMAKVFHDEMDSTFKSFFIENSTLYLINRYILNKHTPQYETMYSIIVPPLVESPHTVKFRAEIINTLNEYDVSSRNVVKISKNVKNEMCETLGRGGVPSPEVIINEISNGVGLKNEIAEISNDIIKTLERHNIPQKITEKICEDYSSYVNKRIIVHVKGILKRRYNYNEVKNVFDTDDKEEITFHKDKLFVSDEDVAKIRRLQKRIRKIKGKTLKDSFEQDLITLKDKYTKEEK